ncbi:hypothetical protein ASPNIDRAFT_52645 [Aspergillus niger ATCC 1015]|uniref:MHD domain-containing protein n=1 Tax=Aspergillus niger (strain ATCC 1015 / CBS 113.46 / FGSC A1144 / LSHB Ac4 / NCTC 3858a / NRRL 328 / USDA 3528.7) TaxID=380704 RepID=G3YHL9_ASPNA|nr:hypothetical protein ASPNIDRAFT_52645 [Aspergillus niger ATCC 1015]
MELSRQEYPALLASLQPGQATSVLNDRIRIINKVNADIADWLQERRRIEELYAQGLRKLAHRPQLDNGAALGVFQIPWQRIIEEDVERPLREYHTKNRELSSLPGIQSDLAGLAKNYEASQKKVEKAKEKGPKGADKLASAVAAAEEISQQWDSRAPFVFEQLQAADEGRLNHLRDALTQLETHETDQVERCRQAAESCLNVLLNVETADEIKTFAAKVNGGRPVVPRRQQTTSPPPVAPLSPPPRLQDDAASQRSEHSGPVRTPPAPEPRHNTPLGGLKRLGTVMNRRRSIVQPSSAGPFFSDKKHRSPFASFKRGDSRELQIPETPTEGMERPSTAMSTQDTEPAGISSEPHEHESFTGATSTAMPQSAPATANGATSHEAPSEEITATAGVSRNEPRVDSEGFTERPETIDEITRAQREAAGLEEPGMNLTIRDQPIFEDEDQAKQAMDDMANQLRMRAQQSGVRRNAGTLRGRRDVRNTVFIPTPAPGNDLPAIPSTLDTSAPTSPSLPAKHVASPSTATDDHAMSDTTSIRSSHTLHSAPGPVLHPDLHEPGLNASIIDTVSAWFTEGAVSKSYVVGELALAYNATPDVTPGSTRVRLDNFQILEKVAANPHFVTEDKGKDQSDEKRGEYDVNLASIARSSPTVAFKYQIHMEPSVAAAYCPVIFRPVWNLEEHQASAIIYYSINSSFTSAPGGTVTLRNLVLTVNLDTSPVEGREVAHATAAVMYPNTGATFRRKQSAVTWKIPELEVKAGSDAKLLVRFSTTASWPRQGKVDAKFEVHTLDDGSRLGISTASPINQVKGSDPFADEEAGSQTPELQPSFEWKNVPTARKLLGGKYVSS